MSLARCAWCLLLVLASAVPSSAADDLLAELKRLPYKILFETWQDNNWELFMVNADGSNRVNLTRTPQTEEHCPHVSGDGRQVCFECDEAAGDKKVRNIYTMNIDGTARKLVARGGRDPCWTADSRGVVYLKDEFPKLILTDYATKGVAIYDLATGTQREHPNRDLYHLYNICCVPGGRWYIATVHAGMGFGHGILAIPTDGNKVFNLKIPGCRPDVSPDGKHVAWGASDYALRIGDLDFSGPEPKVVNAHDVVTSSKPVEVYHVDWSPDGRYVAFSRGPHGKSLGGPPECVGVQAPGWNICAADARAVNRWVAITEDGKSNKEPDWVPLSKGQ